jgi:hypothetical protein
VARGSEPGAELGIVASSSREEETFFRWSEKGGVQKLADGFKGPADFCVVPASYGSITVVVPDLPQSQLRFIHLRK